MKSERSRSKKRHSHPTRTSHRRGATGSAHSTLPATGSVLPGSSKPVEKPQETPVPSKEGALKIVDEIRVALEKDAQDLNVQAARLSVISAYVLLWIQPETTKPTERLNYYA